MEDEETEEVRMIELDTFRGEEIWFVVFLKMIFFI